MPSQPIQRDKLSPEQLKPQDGAGFNGSRPPDSGVLPPSTPRVVTMPPPAPRSEGPPWWRMVGVVNTIRPHQWVKNVFVLAPIVFAKEIFDLALLSTAALAFVVFCLLAGAVYTINDITDVHADRVHPVKRYRPIASGRVPVAYAWLLAVLLVGVSFAAAARGPISFLLVVGGYFFLNLAYTFRLKHVAYVDVGCIAAGFVLRVMAGGFATHIDVSNYLLACTALLALFLGFGKRRHELAGMAWKGGRQRVSLEGYTRIGLDVALGITATATLATYVAYTLDGHTRLFFRSDWLWVSALFVVLGVLRFLHLVRSRPRAESPTQEMLRDGPFVAIMLGWFVLVMWMVYNLRPTP